MRSQAWYREVLYHNTEESVLSNLWKRTVFTLCSFVVILFISQYHFSVSRFFLNGRILLNEGNSIQWNMYERDATKSQEKVRHLSFSPFSCTHIFEAFVIFPLYYIEQKNLAVSSCQGFRFCVYSTVVFLLLSLSFPTFVEWFVYIMLPWQWWQNAFGV